MKRELIQRAMDLWETYETGEGPTDDRLDLAYGPESWEDILGDLLELEEGTPEELEARERIIDVLNDRAAEMMEQDDEMESVEDLQQLVLMAASELIGDYGAVEVAKAAAELVLRLDLAQ
jgi:hypothetical protein